jgi:hypothetical protein
MISCGHDEGVADANGRIIFPHPDDPSRTVAWRDDFTDDESEEFRRLRTRYLAKHDAPILVMAYPGDDAEQEAAGVMHLYVRDPKGYPLFVDAVEGGYGLHLCDVVRQWAGDDTMKIVLRLWPDVPGASA